MISEMSEALSLTLTGTNWINWQDLQLIMLKETHNLSKCWCIQYVACFPSTFHIIKSHQAAILFQIASADRVKSASNSDGDDVKEEPPDQSNADEMSKQKVTLTMFEG